jgi:hypothetical protein
MIVTTQHAVRTELASLQHLQRKVVGISGSLGVWFSVRRDSFLPALHSKLIFAILRFVLHILHNHSYHYYKIFIKFPFYLTSEMRAVNFVLRGNLDNLSL